VRNCEVAALDDDWIRELFPETSAWWQGPSVCPSTGLEARHVVLSRELEFHVLDFEGTCACEPSEIGLDDDTGERDDEEPIWLHNQLHDVQ
jgi:hypothetical protein